MKKTTVFHYISSESSVHRLKTPKILEVLAEYLTELFKDSGVRHPDLGQTCPSYLRIIQISARTVLHIKVDWGYKGSIINCGSTLIAQTTPVVSYTCNKY